MSPIFRSRKAGVHYCSWKKLRARPLLVNLEARDVPASLVVTDPGDTGAPNQLRAIWETARTNGQADTITFSAAANSISLTSPLNTYTDFQNLTINGNGKTVTTINAPAGNRIFSFGVSGFQPTITITDMTLKGGSTSGNGGAILDDNETLVLTNVRFTQNTAASGGAISTLR